MKAYELNLPGLAEAAAACAPGPGHRALVKGLRRLPATRHEEGGSYLSKRGVFDPDGALLHDGL